MSSQMMTPDSSPIQAQNAEAFSHGATVAPDSYDWCELQKQLAGKLHRGERDRGGIVGHVAEFLLSQRCNALWEVTC